MNRQRKLLFLVLLLFIISVSIVVARSPDGYAVQRAVISGGSSANSASYHVDSVFGQMSTGVATSPNHKVSAGFLHPNTSLNTVWVPLVVK